MTSKKPVWASYSQFQWQQEKPVLSIVTSQFQWQEKNQFEPSHSQFEQPGRNQFEQVAASCNNQ